MQFLDQAIEFKPLSGHATATFAAQVSAEDLLRFCVAVHRAERRLVALWGSDERDRREGAGYALHAAFDLAEGLVCLTLPLAEKNPTFPDLSQFFPAANRMQRSVRDMIGAASEDSDQRPWLRHDNWPADHYPLRRDTPDTSFPTRNEVYGFVRVEGDGVHEVAVGPIHAGIIEPGHFRFSVMGEGVLRLEERLGW
ncbi:MAG: NADH-quinone oxidoreductase subunit C [Betaproteobacteria bacterium]